MASGEQTFGMQKAHLNVGSGQNTPTPGIQVQAFGIPTPPRYFAKRVCKLLKTKKGSLKKSAKTKRRQTAENMWFAIETWRHRGEDVTRRAEGMRVHPCGDGKYAQRAENGRHIGATWRI